jgi:hypothetical protein
MGAVSAGISEALVVTALGLFVAIPTVLLFTGGATPPSDGFFDADATFKGAFGTVNWTDGWTAFPAN